MWDIPWNDVFDHLIDEHPSKLSEDERDLRR
jgi:hypothetical protein